MKKKKEINVNLSVSASTIIFRLLILLLALNFQLLPIKSLAQNIGINSTGATPNPKALLDVDASGSSPMKGILLPRMSTEERNTITAPVPESLLIYNTTSKCFEAYNAITEQWISIGCIGCTSAADAPTALSATEIGDTGFTANWNVSSSATNYFLDVSASNTFTDFIAGFNNLDLGNMNAAIVTGLACGTYYYRVRAENACGVSTSSNIISVITCPSEYCTFNSNCNGPLTDIRDGQIYTTVQIGNQCWMAENLNVGNLINSTYNPDPPNLWSQQSDNDVVEKYCYDNNPANCLIYGGMYEWNEMMDHGPASAENEQGPQGICPEGWHLPTDNEWKCMEMNLGMSQEQADATGMRGTDEGGKMKQSGTDLWTAPNTGANNSSGFTGVPGGWRTTSGTFGETSGVGYWWTSSAASSSHAIHRFLYYISPQVFRGNTGDHKEYGMSVRCVKD